MPRVFLNNGVTLHYRRRQNHGPELVLVHGLATNITFWYLRVVPLLGSDFCLTLYDLRGHGKSDMPLSGYTTADMATDLHALFEHLEVRRAHLVGHSYGGSVVLNYTVLHPERVASLTLADVRVRALQPTLHAPGAGNWKRTFDQLQIPVSSDDPEMGHRLLEVLAEAKVRGLKGKDAVVGSFSPFGLSNKSSRTAERWLQLLRTTTARNDFKATAGLTADKITKINHPVLAIFGEFSHCLPSCWGLKRYLENCRVVIVPRAGHFHPIVRPAFFKTQLEKFLAEVRP